jgi:hypothetical protein
MAPVTGTLFLLGAGALLALGSRPGGGAGADRPGMVHAATPHLLPDPALEWLPGFRGDGIWPSRRLGRKGHAIFQSSDPITALAARSSRRLRAASRDCGTRTGAAPSGSTPALRCTTAGGTVVAMLLPPAADDERLTRAKEDLVFLLDGVARRPVLHDLAQVRATERRECGTASACDSPTRSSGS